MTAEYATPDWEVVDYQIYCLDETVTDRQTETPLLLRGPRPQSLEKGEYFICIGAAQTFGRFCQKPFPTLLQERIGLGVINMGRGGAGPSFFSKENDKLLEYVNGAKFAVIQVMAGRSESNSLFESKGLGYYTRLSDGVSMGCDEAFKILLQENKRSFVETIVAETRQNWINSYRVLLQKIEVPKILLWFSERKPPYQESYRDVYALFGEFPQLVNSSMVDQVAAYCDGYAQCVSKKGLPQPLVSRFTGKPVIVKDDWGEPWKKNWYYPSPKMHQDAADALMKVCANILSPVEPRQHNRYLRLGRSIKDIFS